MNNNINNINIQDNPNQQKNLANSLYPMSSQGQLSQNQPSMPPQNQPSMPPSEISQNNKNTIIGISKEEQNDPNIVMGVGNKNELIDDNHLYYNLISLFPLEYDDSKMVENHRGQIISQIRKHILEIKPNLEKIKIKVISSEPYVNISQLTNNIKENREGSVITSHMNKSSEQHSEKYNYVIKKNKNSKRKNRQEGGKKSKKNKYQTGGQSEVAESDNVFGGLENADNTQDESPIDNSDESTSNSNKYPIDNSNDSTQNSNESSLNNSKSINNDVIVALNNSKSINNDVIIALNNHDNLIMGINSNNNSDKETGQNYYIISIKIFFTDGSIEELNKLNIHKQKITFEIDNKKIDFVFDSISKLWTLLNQWDGRNAVNRFVGDKQNGQRVQRFGKSVNYLKKITHRLRDCSEISVAYQIKHQEVQEMLISIRKLYSLILFLRDQIEQNQKNYDTLERLILEIVIAMNQDYHIPYDQLIVLKEVQDKIAKDGKDLE